MNETYRRIIDGMSPSELVLFANCGGAIPRRLAGRLRDRLETFERERYSSVLADCGENPFLNCDPEPLTPTATARRRRALKRAKAGRKVA